MKTFEAIAKKIMRPPGAQNCARLNVLGDELATTNLIARFALSIPAFNYVPAVKQCRTHVQFGLARETAKRAVLRSGSPAGREQNASLVEAFWDYDGLRRYSECRSVEGFSGEFRISRDVRVPTSATFTILEGGKLVPVNVCGWKSLSLDLGQIRLWMSMLEIGLYSHADYRRSPAEVLLFLEEMTDQGPERLPHVIQRGDYNLLSDSEMRDQAELYVRAQVAALPIAEALWNEKQRKRMEEARARNEGDSDQLPRGPDLFD